MTDETALLRRLARTVRVATHTALAEYELGAAAAGGRRTTFQALAAKTADGWRFPDGGLAGADGLVVARLERDGTGAPLRLHLQAQGIAGLTAYAGRSAVLRVGAAGPELSTVFDADGRASVDLGGLGLAEDDLAAFELVVSEQP